MSPTKKAAAKRAAKKAAGKRAPMQAAGKKWAVLVYMAADVQSAQMRSAAKRNLQQMANAGSTDEVLVAAQIDLTGQNTMRYIFPDKTGGGGSVEDLRANINSADPQSIIDFVNWAMGAPYKADKTLMIFWGHGFGLDDFKTKALLPNVPEFRFPAPSAARTRVAALPPPPKDQYALLSDETSNSGLTNEQLAAALEAALQGQKLSILGLDCCLMAMAEVWGAMGNCAELCVGSQSGEPFSSWPYDKILEGLKADPGMTPEKLSTLIVDKFAEYYDGISTKPLVTLSVNDVTKLNDFLPSVKNLATALASASSDSSSREKIFAARNLCPIYDDDGYIDLDCFCAFLEMTPPNTTVSKACQAVRSALNQKFVIHSKFAPDASDQMISLSKGLSVWFPNWIQNPDFDYPEKAQSVQYLHIGYGQTNFAQKTGWDQFLNSIRQAVQS